MLKSAKGQCCSEIEIFCPCEKEDLQHLVRFLYDGEIICDNETDTHKIFDNLSQIFGFPENMHLRCKEIILDENSDDSSLCEDIETITDETFENVTIQIHVKYPENIPLIQDKEVNIEQLESDVVKNIKMVL